MDFGKALNLLKNGFRVSRKGWNGRNSYIFLVDSAEWKVDANSVNGVAKSPFIAMKTTDLKIVPWLASQTDMLADDWIIAE